MTKRFSFVRIFVFILPIMMAAFLFFAVPTVFSSASEDIPISDWEIPLTYDEAPSVTPRKTSSGTYYTIKTFTVNIDGVPVSLLDGEGKVTLTPATYTAKAKSVVASCDEHGTLLEDGQGYVGDVKFVVSGRKKDIFLDAAPTKTYGEIGSAIEWADEEGDLTVRMTSDGFDKAAAVKEYDIVVASVLSGETDVTAYYDVTPKVTGETKRAKYRVTPAAVHFTVPADSTVTFNDFLLEDGESVLTQEVAGANGETVTGYFRLKTPADLLTIGEDYAVELYKISVADEEGTPLSEDAALNYDPSTEPGTVRATAGSVVLTQSAEHTTARYVRLSEEAAFFRYVYLDPAVTSYGETITLEDVEVFPGITVTLSCALSIEDLTAGAPVPCGKYALTLLSYEGEAFTSVEFEDMYITVAPLVLTYAGETTVQYGETRYEYAPTVSRGDDMYTFDLVATLQASETAAHAAVGSALPFDGDDAVSREDPNVHLTYDAARVRVVKRTAGVAFVAADDLTSVYYDPVPSYVPARVELDGEAVTEGTITYYNRTESGTVYVQGLPKNVGSYTIKATFASDCYEAEDAEYEITIVKRPVVAVYEVTWDGTKTYGATFSFTSSNTRLREIWAYDPLTEEADDNVNYLLAATDVRSLSGPIGITSAGMAASAAAGEYDLEYSLTSDYYDVRGIRLYNGAISPENEIKTFTVTKGAMPPAPTLSLSVNNRTITVRRTDGTSFSAELSEKADFTSPQRASSVTGEAQFKTLKYGKRYCVRIRVVDGDNYVTAEGEWSETSSAAISLAAPTVTLLGVTDTEATFEAERISNAAPYTLQHRVGTSGAWTDGLEVTGLTPDSDVTVYFRAKTADVSGAETSLSVRTKRAPVKASDVTYTYDRQKGVLSVTSSVEIEMCLLTKEGVLVCDWTTEDVFSDVARDGEYILQVRNAADATSAVTKIEIDTFKAKEPFTLGGFLSDWFLIFVAAAVIAALVVTSVSFAKLVKKIDLSARGGKNEK